MARTINEIQDQIRVTYVANMNAIGIVVNPANWSETSVEKLFCDTVAFCFWVLETIFDTFKSDVNSIIAEKKPHSTRWYANKSKDFRYGYDLIPESDTYDDTGLTSDQIAASKVVNHCAVVEQEISPGRYGLRIKVATISGSDLADLPTPQLAAFKQYMAEVKDAGVGLLITTGPADSLKLKLRVYYDPLVLNNQGQRLDGTDMEPVQSAIKTYLKNLPFNGVFVLAFLIDQLQKVEGVVIPHLLDAQARYGVLDYTAFAVEYLPDAGYLRLIDMPNDLTIEWVARGTI
jgi:hypothetical protein